jgi:hypothetical protein
MSALRSLTRISVLIATVLPCGGRLEAGREPISYDRPLNAYDRGVVERVRARAAAKLDDPECGKVLTDFTDRGGRTLESNLEPLGVSASEYLLHISFLDGSRLPACRTLEVIMATTPGVPRVFVCPAGTGKVASRLSRMEFESWSRAEAMVIHEMLHTLGLGENPPSTFEITDRVRARCR